MHIPNDETQNYPSCRLESDTQLIEPTNQNSQMSPKLLSKPIRKYYHKTLGTSVINSTMSPVYTNAIFQF